MFAKLILAGVIASLSISDGDSLYLITKGVYSKLHQPTNVPESRGVPSHHVVKSSHTSGMSKVNPDVALESLGQKRAHSPGQKPTSHSPEHRNNLKDHNEAYEEEPFLVVQKIPGHLSSKPRPIQKKHNEGYDEEPILVVQKIPGHLSTKQRPIQKEQNEGYEEEPILVVQKKSGHIPANSRNILKEPNEVYEEEPAHVYPRPRPIHRDPNYLSSKLRPKEVYEVVEEEEPNLIGRDVSGYLSHKQRPFQKSPIFVIPKLRPIQKESYEINVEGPYSMSHNRAGYLPVKPPRMHKQSYDVFEQETFSIGQTPRPEELDGKHFSKYAVETQETDMVYEENSKLELMRERYSTGLQEPDEVLQEVLYPTDD